MQELASDYGQSKLGVYMLSTSEKWEEITKYKYEELQERVQAKPASIICVYQTAVKDWCIFYPSYLKSAIPEPQGYFNHVHDLLSKMDLANSYANIVNYTYELYPDLNELVTQEANKQLQEEYRDTFIKESVFYFIQLVLLQLLVGLAIAIVQKDYVYASNTQLFSHIHDAIESDNNKIKAETSRNIRKFDKEAENTVQNVEVPEWIRYENLTSRVKYRLSKLAEQLDNSDINSNTARLVDRLDELDNIVSQRYLKNFEQNVEAPAFIQKFYRSYFLMLMNLIEQMEKYIDENDLQKIHSYNEGIELYGQITTSVLKKLKQSGIDTIRVSVEAIKKGAVMDGLIDVDDNLDTDLINKRADSIEGVEAIENHDATTENHDSTVENTDDTVENKENTVENREDKQDNRTEENVDEH